MTPARRADTQHHRQDQTGFSHPHTPMAAIRRRDEIADAARSYDYTELLLDCVWVLSGKWLQGKGLRLLSICRDVATKYDYVLLTIREAML
jgi:hypothetical protein